MDSVSIDKKPTDNNFTYLNQPTYTDNFTLRYNPPNVTPSIKKMKVYYSHPVQIYGGNREKEEIELIKKFLPSYKIINPKHYQKGYLNYLDTISELDKSLRSSGSEFPIRKIKFNYWLQIIDTCQALAFSRYDGQITEGVLAEAEYAGQINLDIYEILVDKLVKTHKGYVTDRGNIIDK